MGGHGGLNILPQKRWNVYNRDNRERVARDEAAAAREESLRADAARREASAARIALLRASRNLNGVPTSIGTDAGQKSVATEVVADDVNAAATTSRPGLLDLTADFSALGSADGARGAGRKPNRDSKFIPNSNKRKRKEEEPRVIGPDEEKCRLGYGVAGKGVIAPWYVARPQAAEEPRPGNGAFGGEDRSAGSGSDGKRTVQQLREERMKREKKEKERERALLAAAAARDSAANGGFSKHRKRC